MAGQKKQKKPKVLVLFCGGTLVMEEDKNGTLLPTSKERAIEILLGMEPRLRERIDMDVTYIDNIDSTNMRPEHWDKMADVIGREYEKYDGFVITHGVYGKRALVHATKSRQARCHYRGPNAGKQDGNGCAPQLRERCPGCHNEPRGSRASF